MRIRISEGAPGPTLLDVDTFDRFSVEVTAQYADGRLAPVGRRVGDHVYVPREVIRDLAGVAARDASWCARLDEMFAYAAANGWTDAAGNVRAHIEIVNEPAAQRGIV